MNAPIRIDPTIGKPPIATYRLSIFTGHTRIPTRRSPKGPTPLSRRY